MPSQDEQDDVKVSQALVPDGPELPEAPMRFQVQPFDKYDVAERCKELMRRASSMCRPWRCLPAVLKKEPRPADEVFATLCKVNAI